MRIKDLTFSQLLSVAVGNNNYNSDDWFLFVKNRLPLWIQRTAGGRELFPWVEHAEDPTAYAAADIDILFEFNSYKYRHLWELYVAKYNPIWNVDGTETETITRHLESNRDISKDNSGTQTTTNTGTVTNEASGEDTLTNGRTVTESGTTYDSGTLLTRSQTANSGDDVTEYGRTDTRTDDTTSERTDDLNETTDDDVTEEETITTTKTRGGNIGVTKTTDMEKDELAWAESFKLLEEITADVCNFIAYGFM